MNGPCAVRDKCGPTGKECRSDDRECQAGAVQLGLEIVCESSAEAPPVYVYCPTATQARDSGVVWLLLAVAVLIAVGGGALLTLLIRRKRV